MDNRSRRGREVAEPQPQHDGAGDPLGLAEAAGDAIDDLEQDRLALGPFEASAREGALRADRPSAAAGVDSPRVAVVADRVEVVARAAAEDAAQHAFVELGDVGDGVKAFLP